MNRRLISVLGWLLVLSADGLLAADEKPKTGCTDPSAQQFDFWVGSWRVTQNGKPAGTNVIERILDGCALLENWSGAKGGAGKSLNFYDRSDGLWHQTWIDRNGGALFLSGKFANGAMRLTGERPATPKQPAARHRITWTPLPNGTVRQVWESSPGDRESWSVQFDGLYERGK
jgi:hypothetical protein